MDEFYISAIQNIVAQSETDNQARQPAGDLLEFEELLPLLSNISEPSYALTGARWLAQHLQGEKNRRKALEMALEVARKTKEQAGSEVRFE